MASAVFDPTQPFEVIPSPPSAALKFDPSQPFEALPTLRAAAPRFDPAQPFEVLTDSQPVAPVDGETPPNPPMPAAQHAYGRFMQSFYGGLAAIPEAAAVLAEKPAAIMESILPLEGGKTRGAEENLLFKSGQALRDAIAKERPIDPARPKSFLSDTLPSGAGSMASFIGTGGGLRALGVTKTAGQVAAGVAAVGAAVGGAEAYREAIANGADDDTAFKVFAANAALGSTEAVPIAGWLNRLNRASGNKLKRAIIEGSEELAQEVFQQYGGNLIASETYDPKRKLSEGLIEGGAAGFTLGSLMSLVVSAIGGRAARATEQSKGQDATTTIPVEGSVPIQPQGTPIVGKAQPETGVRDSLPSPAGQPPQRPNAPAQGAQATAVTLPKVGDWIQFQEGFPNPRTITAQVVRLANNPVPGAEPIIPVVQRASGEEAASEWFSSGKIVSAPEPASSTETPSEAAPVAEQPTNTPVSGVPTAPPPPVTIPPVLAEGNTPVAPSKEPWQMTKAEFAAVVKESGGSWPALYKRWGLWMEGADNFNANKHRLSIDRAIQEGKPVPQEVLGEYPDLISQPPAPTGLGAGAATAVGKPTQAKISPAEKHGFKTDDNGDIIAWHGTDRPITGAFRADIQKGASFSSSPEDAERYGWNAVKRNSQDPKKSDIHVYEVRIRPSAVSEVSYNNEGTAQKPPGNFDAFVTSQAEGDLEVVNPSIIRVVGFHRPELSEPLDALGNPESFYNTKSLMGAQMRRSPKLAAALKFYKASSVKRLNELATRRFAEIRERAAAPSPVVEPEPKPEAPPPPPKKPREAPPIAPVEEKASPVRNDSTEFDRLIIENGPELEWEGDWDTLLAGKAEDGSTMAIEGKKRYSQALKALRRYAASVIGAEQSDMDSLKGRAAALPALRRFLEGGMEAGVQTEIPEDASTDFLPPEPEAAEPALELSKPESVEEQNARLASDDAARKAKADKEKLTEKAAAPLRGTSGDLGQGDLLDAPTDLFAPTAPKTIGEFKFSLERQPVDNKKWEKYGTGRDQQDATLVNHILRKAFLQRTGNKAYASIDSVVAFRPELQVGTEFDRRGVDGFENLFGKRLVFFQDVVGGAKFGGLAYSGEPDVIFVNIDDAHPWIRVAGHELFHQLKFQRPDLYREVFNALKSDLAQNRTALARRYGALDYTPSEVPEEVLADLLGDVITDPAFWGRFQQRSPGKFQEVVRSILDWINQAIRFLSDQKYGATEFFKNLTQARDVMADVAARYAGERVELSPSGSDLKFSLERPDASEKAVLESEAFKRNLDLADELGKIVPEDGDAGVPTKVGNVEDMVLTRPGLNAAVRDDSVTVAAEALREAGLNIVRHEDGLWDLADRVTPQDMAGNVLVPILEREIQAARSTNRPERIANLLNTVVVHLARDGNQAFSQGVRNQLYALAQSVRSAYGRALGGLAMWGKVLANIAQSPGIHLHRIYSQAVGGPEVESVIKKLLTVFRDYFSPEEIRKALNPLDLNETARRLIQLKDQDTGGRVYRQVQQRLRGTPPKTQKQKNRRAVEDDAIESLIRQAADLGHIEPPKPKNQKLTADEQLKLLSNPDVAANVQQATETAVQNAEFNAGWKAEANAAKGDEEAMADVAERKAIGEDPSPAMIEEGLNLPEFEHWRDIRDNFLDYSPTTLKVVQGVIKGRFKGAKFGVTEPKPAEFRIDFKKLAVEPDAEVQRVFDAQVAVVRGLMDKATPATVARLSAVFRQNIEEQLARHRKETVDKLFAEKKLTGKSDTEIEALKKQINAGLLRDQRLSDAEMAQMAADKSTLRNVLPSVTELVERIVTSPRYKMEDIKTDVAAALVKELGLTDAEASNLANLVYRALDGTDAKPGPLREASRKALEQVQTALSPADRKILFKKHIMSVDDIRGRKPGRTLWELIERGARAGLFDPTPVLETMASAIGFKVPTAEEKARMKSWAEEEIRLRTPTQRQIDKEQGTPEEKLAKATRAAEAGTESDRLALIRKIQANWSRWSMPIGLRHFLDPVITRNNTKAANEFVSANLLAKLGFFFRQGLDVGLVSMPLNAVNRSLAHVLERAENAGGFTDATVKDLDAATKEMVTARLASLKATLVAATRTAGGHTNRKVLDRMNHSVGVFDRMRAKADELEAQGNLAGARALRVGTLIEIGYRIAMTWDTVQSVGAEWQEMRQQLSTDLRRSGKTHAQIATTLDDIFGSIKLDMAESVAEVNAIAVERGNRSKSKNAIQADAWGLIKAKAYDRMRTAAGTTTDYEAENEQYKELHSWNLPETGGVGGVIAETIKTIKKNTEKAGIPTGGLFSFGNAMGIAANRMLTFSGGGLFGGFGFGDSPWYQGTRNQRQRRLEAIEGLTAIAIVIALAAAGKLLIQTKYPEDKDEKEKFIADGHKLNTLRWTNGDGSWVEYPIRMSPFGFIASPLYMVGGVQRLLSDQVRAQEKLDAEAARTGKVAGKAKAVDAGDVMGVLAQGVYGMLTGGRTASGAIQSFTDYGDFKLNKAVSSLASPYIPGLPAWQEAARAMGATMDTRTANVLELLVPTPWSGNQRVNSLGDPLTNLNAMSRLSQVMSGGIGWGDGALPSDHPYRTLVQAGYAPPAINPNKGYDFDGTIRPMTGPELESYAIARGEAFKQELSGVNVDRLSEPEARKAVQAAYQRANRTALASVGVSVPAKAPRAATGVSTSGSQRLTGAPAGVQGGGIPRLSSRLGPARGNATLRFARRPSRGVRLRSRRGSLMFRRGPTVRRRGTLRLPGRSGSLRLRRPRVRQS